jgi:AAA+ ATPase superfamily predicted ATPase
MTIKTPFIYDRPVRGDEFVNRERELRSIFNGLRLGESYAISGAPRLGKTSLLLRLNDEITQREYLGVSVKQFVFVLRSLHDSSSDYTPATFWKESNISCKHIQAR